MEWAVRRSFLPISSVVIVGLSLIVAGCDDSGANGKGPAAAALQPSDLKATRLSSAERQGFAALCRKTWDTAPQNRGKPAQAELKVSRDLEKVCDCFIDQLEDRTSKLEFLIAMEVLRTANSAYGEPNLRPLEAGASKIGVTGARFQEMHVDARKASAATIKGCVERVTSSQ